MASFGYTFTDYSLPYNEFKDKTSITCIPPPSSTKQVKGLEEDAKEEVANKFVSALKKETNRGLTENASPTYTSSGKKILDFGFQVLENTQDSRVLELLKESWEEDAESTLRLVANLRDVRSGKSCRYKSYLCLYWLYENHPLTLLKNLENFADVGYLKDLLNLMMIVAFNGYISKVLELEEDPSMVHSRRKLARVEVDKSEKRDADDQESMEVEKEEVGQEWEQKVKKALKRMSRKRALIETKVYISLMSDKPLYTPLRIRKEAKLRRNQNEASDSEMSITSESDGFAIVDKRAAPNSKTRQRKQVKEATPCTNPCCPNCETPITCLRNRCSQLKMPKNMPLEEVKNMSDEQLSEAIGNLCLDVSQKDLVKELRRGFAKQKYASNEKYRLFLHAVADIFASRLHADSKNFVEHNDFNKSTLSFAAKWAPSPKGHHDKYLHISSLIGLKLKELSDGPPSFETEAEFVLYAHLAREEYRKEVSRLRKISNLPEINITNKEFDKINYKHVPSKAFQKYKKLFMAKDGERFNKFISKTKKVGGKSLKPVELITEIYNQMYAEEDMTQIAEVWQKQWNSLVDNLGKSKSLGNSITICDISGSMSGVPMMAAIGLTLLTTEVNNAPWNSVCITFSETPQVFELSEKDSILERVKHIVNCPFGYNTDFNAVIELVLKMGKENKLTQEEMPEFLFVFTDMEFDCAFPATGMTNFEWAKNLFQKEGYTLPKIIFWNLRGTVSTPVKEDEEGVILLSGYSDKTMKALFEADLDCITPMAILKEILDQYPQFTV